MDLFNKEVYNNRRDKLRTDIKDGLLLFIGNQEASYNYPANVYAFRQDSNFLYFFGLNMPDLVGVIDVDNNKDYVFGNDVDIDDIIWMGPQPSMTDLGKKVAIENTSDLASLNGFLEEAIKAGRKIHILPTY